METGDEPTRLGADEACIADQHDLVAVSVHAKMACPILDVGEDGWAPSIHPVEDELHEDDVRMVERQLCILARVAVDRTEPVLRGDVAEAADRGLVSPREGVAGLARQPYELDEHHLAAKLAQRRDATALVDECDLGIRATHDRWPTSKRGFGVVLGHGGPGARLRRRRLGWGGLCPPGAARLQRTGIEVLERGDRILFDFAKPRVRIRRRRFDPSFGDRLRLRLNGRRKKYGRFCGYLGPRATVTSSPCRAHHERQDDPSCHAANHTGMLSESPGQRGVLVLRFGVSSPTRYFVDMELHRSNLSVMLGGLLTVSMGCASTSSPASQPTVGSTQAALISYDEAMQKPVSMGDVTKKCREKQLSDQQVVAEMDRQLDTMYRKCVVSEYKRGGKLDTVTIDIAILGDGSVQGATVSPGKQAIPKLRRGRRRRHTVPRVRGAPNGRTLPVPHELTAPLRHGVGFEEAPHAVGSV